jgi:F-type H+-transporting ATPase subunit epsilon
MTLHLASATAYQRVEQVVAFVGEDASGSFGLLPGHEPFATVLEFGLARFRAATASWQYVAVPGAVLFLSGEDLHLSARRYVVGADAARIAEVLRHEIRAEEQSMAALKQGLRLLEDEMLKRLLRLGRGRSPS